MWNHHRSMRWLTTCAVAGVLSLAGASSVACAQARLPQPKMQDGVTYLSGGVGEEELHAVKSVMRDYSLALVFSRRGGDYVADVAITIMDANGATVLAVPFAGPYLLVKLPAGRYSVVADFHGDTKVRPVVVRGAASAPTGFSWP